MLCQFTFGNFKSFKEEATLDLCAQQLKEHENSLIIDTMDGESFLPIAAIYGLNGGGKSTVLNAFAFLSHTVLQSNQPLDECIIVYHLFDKVSMSLPIKFDILFRISGMMFRYQLNLLHSVIKEEYLYARDLSTGEPKIIFERNASSIYAGNTLQGITFDNITPTMPLLSYLSVNCRIEIINTVIKWFSTCIIRQHDNPNDKYNLALLKDKDVENTLLKMLAGMDIGIAGIALKEDTEGQITGIDIVHCCGKKTTVTLPLEESSMGIRRLIGLLPSVLTGLQKGNLILVDDLDAYLHPKLFHYIVGLFTNPLVNTKGAQLVFTAHDTSIMDCTVMRQDEIWFSAINKEKTSTLYSLVDFEKKHSSHVDCFDTYGKQYLGGRYGADPHLGAVFDWRKYHE